MKKCACRNSDYWILIVVLAILLTVFGISYFPQHASSDETNTGNISPTIDIALNTQIAEIFRQKQSLTPAQQKIDWNLLQTIQKINEQVPSSPIKDSFSFQNFSTSMFQINNEGVIEVKLTVSDNISDEQINQLKALGMDITITLPEYEIVEGSLPHNAVETVASLDFVKHVSPPGYPIYNTGLVTSEGDSVLQADLARSTFGINGSGSKIGVISDGVDHWGLSLLSGDLWPIQVVRSGSGDEGTAMLEIIYDLAPGADLAFYSPNTSSDMVVGIGALESAGCNIIVDDLTFSDEPKFEDGPIAQRARQFVNDGGIYVTSAGNGRDSHYISNYRRGAFNKGDYTYAHDYNPSATIDSGNTFTIPDGYGIIALLQWNNEWGISPMDDFDFYLLDTTFNTVYAGSADDQAGGGSSNPWEGFLYINDTGSTLTVNLVVTEWNLVNAPSSIVLDYHVWYCPSTLQYSSSEDSVIGHSAIEEVLSTAAVDAATPSTIEYFSSCGPGTIYFPSYQQRQVPNITGTDGVQTRTGQLGYFSNPFYGTSAAAPHIAAIAALVWDANPTLNSSQVRNAITSTAVDLSTTGFDYYSGWGRADAYAAADYVAKTLNISTTSGGTVTDPGIGPFGPYLYGQAVPIVAVANPCYHFVEWTGDTAYIANTGASSTTITMYDSYSVTANFAIDTFTLTYNSGSGGSVSGTTPQTVDCYADGSAVTAVPDPCYYFVDWSDASTENPRTDTDVTGDITVTANFAPTGATYNLTINSSEYGNVSIPGEGPSGPYACGSSVNLSAIADTCCGFVNWTGDTNSIVNPNAASTTILMNGSKIIQANFIVTPWDVNCEGNVNVLDMILIGQHWGQTGAPGWIPEDINGDGTVNVLDMILVGQHWTG